MSAEIFNADLSKGHALKDAVLTAVWTQKDQFFLWLPVLFGSGIALYFSLSQEPPASLVITALIAIAALFTVTYKDIHKRWLIAFIAMFVFGFAAAQYRTHAVFTPILSKKTGGVDVSGIIDSIEDKEERRGQRVTLSHVKIQRLAPEETPRKFRISFKKTQDIQIGQSVSVRANLSPPSPPVLPGGFDFQRYMYFKGIGATGFAYSNMDAKETGDVKTPVFKNIRRNVSRKINEALDHKPHQAAIINALLTGQRGAISESDANAIRDAGLAHMLAISGLHIGLFTGIVFFAVRLILALIPGWALKYPIKKYAALCAMAAALFYMFLAGATVPTQRATLMTAIVLLAVFMDRSPLSLRLVATAALAVLIIAPESLLSASFHMSFAAVTALIVVYEAMRPWWAAQYAHSGMIKRASLYVLGICLTSLIASIATAPFVLFHFQKIALYGLLGNVLAMPILSFIVMPMGVLSFLLMPFGLEGYALQAASFGVDGILKIAHEVASLDHAVWRVSLWPTTALLYFTAAFLCAALLKGKARWLSLLPLVLSTFTLSQIQTPAALISQNAKLAAFVEDSGAASFSSLNKERFVRQSWLSALGMPEDQARKWPKEGEQDNISCGPQGCRLHSRAGIIDVLKTQAGFIQSCKTADVIIGMEPLRRKCPGKIVIDKFDAFRNGAYAIYPDRKGKGLVVKNVEQQRRSRPWNAGFQKRQKGNIQKKNRGHPVD